MNLKLIGIHWVTVTALLLTGPAQAEPDGLASQPSAKDYTQTVVALRETLNGSDAKIFQEIDHRNTKIDKDVDLPPSHVFIFGNSQADSWLMQCAPLVAVDLPMRMLVKRDREDNTTIYWTKASTLIERYSSSRLSDQCREFAVRIDKTLVGLAREAAEED